MKNLMTIHEKTMALDTRPRPPDMTDPGSDAANTVFDVDRHHCRRICPPKSSDDFVAGKPEVGRLEFVSHEQFGPVAGWKAKARYVAVRFEMLSALKVRPLRHLCGKSRRTCFSTR
jgi:hypothetical protein